MFDNQEPDYYDIGFQRGIGEVIDWFKSSERATFFRDHNMTVWHQVVPFVKSKIMFRSTCMKCGREVDVILNPAPNETNVSGPAVAVNCDA